jgi:hypothetical protein
MPTFKNDVTGNDEHAIVGVSPNGRGVVGWSDTAYGVSGDSKKSAGVRGTSVDGRGTEGWSTNSEGVVGISTHSTGVWGQTEGAGVGVAGTSKTGKGVYGVSESGSGVYGRCQSGRAIEGWSETNYGVTGDSQKFAGVRGTSLDGTGTEGWSTKGTGVFATSEHGEGLHAETKSATTAAIAAYNLNPAGTGAAIFAKKAGSQGHAGFFDGDVFVTGDISCHNADCAEDFDIAEPAPVEPGTVLVMGDGGLRQSSAPYDKRVVGVVSGAGDYRPGLVLDRQRSRAGRQPVALLGKVFCKVDANFGGIEVGDLLTTSSTPGHAMRTEDPDKAFGTVIGKALGALDRGQGLIPILVALK